MDVLLAGGGGVFVLTQIGHESGDPVLDQGRRGTLPTSSPVKNDISRSTNVHQINTMAALDPAATPLMRKLTRNDDEKIVGHLRWGMARSGVRRYLYAAVAVLLIFLGYRWITRQPEYNPAFGYRGEIMTPPVQPVKPHLNTVSLEIYMEAQCPDTSRFLHKQLTKAWASLGHTGRVDLTLVPFGKARCIEKGDDFECSCQHGSNECELNQLMNCVIDRVGFPDKFVPVIDCIQGKGNLAAAMSSCVSNNPLLNEKQMSECASGERGRRLLALAGSRTVGLKPALNFVPWIVIDGERNSDALYDLTENLCKKLEPAPEECAVYSSNAVGQ